MSGVVKLLTYLGCRSLVFMKDLVLCKMVLRSVTGKYFSELKKKKNSKSSQICAWQSGGIAVVQNADILGV